MLAQEKRSDPPYSDPRGSLTYTNALFAQRVLHEKPGR
jgi:hypothetical protein